MTKISADGLRVIHSECVPASNMTLRDYFAAKAMQTLISVTYSSNPSLGVDDVWLEEKHTEAIADQAYVLADVMVNARDIP